MMENRKTLFDIKQNQTVPTNTETTTRANAFRVELFKRSLTRVRSNDLNEYGNDMFDLTRLRAKRSNEHATDIFDLKRSGSKR